MELQKNIRVFNLKFDREFRDKFIEGCEKIFDEGYLSNHTYVREFERELACIATSSYAIAACNGTGSLEMILRSLDVEGKEVVLPANTFIATMVAVQNAGGIPVLADIEPDYLGIAPAELKKNINSKTAAVIAVHIGGLISPGILELQNICAENSLPLVEDLAQAFLSSLNGKQAGSFGVAGSTSFFTTKVMTTGEGGAVFTNDKNLYEKLLSIRQFGKELQNDINHYQRGSNFKLSEFQALCGILELNRVKERIAKRKQLAHRYQERLHGSPWKPMKPAPDSESSYYKQIIIPPKNVTREAAKQVLENKNIALTGGVYYVPLHRQPVNSGRFQNRKFPNADNFADTHICVPCYPELDLSDVDFVCNALLDIQS